MSAIVRQLALVLPRVVEMDFREFHFHGTSRSAFRYFKLKVAAFSCLMLLSSCRDVEIK